MQSKAARAGFTLIELMIVISIIIDLGGHRAVQYQKSVQRAKEATLKQDLQAMRQSIDNYTLDKQPAPQISRRFGTGGLPRLFPGSDDRRGRLYVQFRQRWC